MNQVEIVIDGKRALVPEKYAKKVLRKEKLVAEAKALKANGNNYSSHEFLELMDNIVAKIIRLNRQIPPVVQFIE